MTVKIGEYKGNPTIELSPEKVILRKDGSKPFGFSFGLGKARLILANIEDIRKFVEEYGSKREGSNG